METKTTLPERLMLCRKRAKKSQAAVSRHMGVAITTIVRWETGRVPPRTHELIAMADLYGASAGYILTGEGPVERLV